MKTRPGIYGDKTHSSGSMCKAITEKLPITESNKLAERYNEGKLKWHNFPMFLIEPLAKVAHYGSIKYETYNFLKGAPINQYLDSLKRHLTSFESPYESDIDDESKESHLAHIAWNALVALHVLKNKPELDNRYKIDEIGKMLSDLESREFNNTK